MRSDAFHRRLVLEGPRGALERLLFLLLLPAGWIFAMVGRLRVLLYQAGILPRYRPPVPVVSVGNLAVGGTGKTPATDFVVKHFLSLGLKVAVVSRGYGGKGVKGVGVVSSGGGTLLPPETCGDEPFLLARRNPDAMVLVASRRAKGVRLAVEELDAEVVVLDDGFQHLAVARDLDIVLLDSRFPLGNGKVLPAGLLREPPSALARGGLFLLTRCNGESRDPSLPGPVLHSRHVLDGEAVSLSGERVSLESLNGKRGLAFAGIADPEAFFAELSGQGLELAGTLSFSDHADYGVREREILAEKMPGVDYLITTEKDGVKLGDLDFRIPCYQVPLSLRFFEEGAIEAFLQRVLER